MCILCLSKVRILIVLLVLLIEKREVVFGVVLWFFFDCCCFLVGLFFKIYVGFYLFEVGGCELLVVYYFLAVA